MGKNNLQVFTVRNLQDSLFNKPLIDNWVVTTNTTAGSWTGDLGSVHIGDYFDWWWDFPQKFEETIKNTGYTAPSYPVKMEMDNEGTTYYTIAAQGLKKENIKVTTRESILKVEIKRDKEGNVDNKIKKKEIYNNLVMRNETLSFDLSDKCDLDKIDVSLEDGLLFIKVPFKKEHVPIEKEYKIK